jgi:hypothetical protein
MNDQVIDVEPKTPQPTETPPTGEPAFPFSFKDHEDNHRWCQGMWIRDYFAAKALTGLLNEERPNIYQVARDAYRLADAMMEERKLK